MASTIASSTSSAPSKAASEAYLTSLLNKTLRITTSDARLFLGEFKCTDSENNVILSRTYEYRIPPPPTPSPASAAATNTNLPSPAVMPSPRPSRERVVQDVPSRYLGLVVIPGEHITKIEVEEFVSQVRGGGSKWALGPVDAEGVAGGKAEEKGKGKEDEV